MKSRTGSITTRLFLLAGLACVLVLTGGGKDPSLAGDQSRGKGMSLTPGVPAGCYRFRACMPVVLR